MKCFVMMPFATEFDDVYHAIKRSGISAGAIDCFRLDDQRPGGRILNRLFNAIAETDLCIADLSDSKPNVMWELGYAMANEKHPILLTREGQTLPFDLHDMHQIAYDRNKLVQTLERPLIDSLRDSVKMLETQPRRLSDIESLRRDFKRLHELVGQADPVSWTRHRTYTVADTQRRPSLEQLSGAWTERVSCSRAYARFIHGKLVAVYCYEGNNELSGVYFDWRMEAGFIFARYQWRQEPISGFSFLTAESDSLLTGNWWFDSDVESSGITPPSAHTGWRAEWQRLPEAPTPRWAEDCFEEIASIGIEELLKRWRAPVP